MSVYRVIHVQSPSHLELCLRQLSSAELGACTPPGTQCSLKGIDNDNTISL